MWHTMHAGKEAGCLTKAGYVCIKAYGKVHKAHRVAYEMHYGPIATGLYVDHVNGVKSDNRARNLRAADACQSNRNRGIQKSNKSGYKGVIFWRGRWRANITVNHKIIWLGLFDTAEEAYAAYCAASAELHGEFSRIN